MVNQLPESVTRRLHGSQICFAAFIQQKITKLLIAQQPPKIEKKLEQIWNLQNFRKILMYVGRGGLFSPCRAGDQICVNMTYIFNTLMVSYHQELCKVYDITNNFFLMITDHQSIENMFHIHTNLVSSSAGTKCGLNSPPHPIYIKILLKL